MDRRTLGSWLYGPGRTQDADPSSADPNEYSGKRLGLPRTGPGSLATLLRRVAALSIDWFASYLVVLLIIHDMDVDPTVRGFLILGVFAAEVWLLTSLMGASFGQRIVGIGVCRVDGHRLNPLLVLLRTILICLVIPAVVWDRDGRGLHDRAVNGICIRTRESRKES